ncbi:MAG: hypothetical protein ACRDSR_15120 [Pseudonocardiaceae bacterium]
MNQRRVEREGAESGREPRPQVGPRVVKIHGGQEFIDRDQRILEVRSEKELGSAQGE